MRPPTTAMILALLATGCSSPVTDDDSAVASDDDDDTASDCVENLEASLQTADITPGFTVDWSGLTETDDGEPVQPESCDLASFLLLDLVPADAIQGTCDGTLQQGDVTLYVFNPAATDSTSVTFDTTQLEDEFGDGRTAVAVISCGDGKLASAFVAVDDRSGNSVIYVQ